VLPRLLVMPLLLLAMIHLVLPVLLVMPLLLLAMLLLVLPVLLVMPLLLLAMLLAMFLQLMLLVVLLVLLSLFFRESPLLPMYRSALLPCLIANRDAYSVATAGAALRSMSKSTQSAHHDLGCS